MNNEVYLRLKFEGFAIQSAISPGHPSALKVGAPQSPARAISNTIDWSEKKELEQVLEAQKALGAPHWVGLGSMSVISLGMEARVKNPSHC